MPSPDFDALRRDGYRNIGSGVAAAVVNKGAPEILNAINQVLQDPEQLNLPNGIESILEDIFVTGGGELGAFALSFMDEMMADFILLKGTELASNAMLNQVAVMVSGMQMIQQIANAPEIVSIVTDVMQGKINGAEAAKFICGKDCLNLDKDSTLGKAFVSIFQQYQMSSNLTNVIVEFMKDKPDYSKMAEMICSEFTTIAEDSQIMENIKLALANLEGASEKIKQLEVAVNKIKGQEAQVNPELLDINNPLGTVAIGAKKIQGELGKQMNALEELSNATKFLTNDKKGIAKKAKEFREGQEGKKLHEIGNMKTTDAVSKALVALNDAKHNADIRMVRFLGDVVGLKSPLKLVAGNALHFCGQVWGGMAGAAAFDKVARGRIAPIVRQQLNNVLGDLNVAPEDRPSFLPLQARADLGANVIVVVGKIAGKRIGKAQGINEDIDKLKNDVVAGMINNEIFEAIKEATKPSDFALFGKNVYLAGQGVINRLYDVRNDALNAIAAINPFGTQEITNEEFIAKFNDFLKKEKDPNTIKTELKEYLSKAKERNLDILQAVSLQTTVISKETTPEEKLHLGPLSIAAFNGNAAMCKALLESGLATAEAEFGITPLHLAIKGGHAEVINTILDILEQYPFSLDVEAGTTKATPLLTAAFYGDLATVERLIKLGANINAKTISGFSVLHAACVAQPPNLELITMLIQNGAKISSYNLDGDTPLNCLDDNESFEADLFLDPSFTKAIRSCLEIELEHFTADTQINRTSRQILASENELTALVEATFQVGQLDNTLKENLTDLLNKSLESNNLKFAQRLMVRGYAIPLSNTESNNEYLQKNLGRLMDMGFKNNDYKFLDILIDIVPPDMLNGYMKQFNSNFMEHTTLGWWVDWAWSKVTPSTIKNRVLMSLELAAYSSEQTPEKLSKFIERYKKNSADGTKNIMDQFLDPRRSEMIDQAKLLTDLMLSNNLDLAVDLIKMNLRNPPLTKSFEAAIQACVNQMIINNDSSSNMALHQILALNLPLDYATLHITATKVTEQFNNQNIFNRWFMASQPDTSILNTLKERMELQAYQISQEPESKSLPDSASRKQIASKEVLASIKQKEDIVLTRLIEYVTANQHKYAIPNTKISIQSEIGRKVIATGEYSVIFKNGVLSVYDDKHGTHIQDKALSESILDNLIMNIYENSKEILVEANLASCLMMISGAVPHDDTPTALKSVLSQLSVIDIGNNINIDSWEVRMNKEGAVRLYDKNDPSFNITLIDHRTLNIIDNKGQKASAHDRSAFLEKLNTIFTKVENTVENINNKSVALGMANP